MTQRGDAYVIATAIYAGTKNKEVVDIDELTDRLYSAVVVMGWSEDFSADVYAQLAEKLSHDTPFEKAVAVIESALSKTGARFG